MAIKEYEIKADTSEAVASVEELRNSISETGKEVDALGAKQEESSKKATKATREQESEERKLAQAKKEVIRDIDRATGGYIELGQKAFKAFQLIKLGVSDAVSKVKEWRAAFSIQSLIMQAVSSVKLFGQTLQLAFTNGAAAAKVLRVALISTGIGALVVAVGALVAYWDEIKGAISGASVELTKNKALAEQNAKAQQEALDAISLQENSLKLQGKSEREIRDLKIQQTDETIKALEAQLLAQSQIQKSQIDAANRNKQILQGVIRFLTLPLSILLGTIDSIGKTLGKDFGLEEKFSGGLASLVFDPEEVKAEGEEAIKETQSQLAKLKSTRDGFLLQEKKENEDAAKAAGDKRDKDAADALAKEKARLSALASLKKETSDIIDANEEAAIKDELERENARFNNQQEKLQREREEQIKAAEGDQMLIAAINAKYNALDEQATLSHNAKIEGFTKASEDKLKAQKEQVANINIGLIENETTRALAALKLKYDAEYAAAEGNAELQLALQKQYIKESAAIQEDADAKAKNKKREYQEELRDLVVGSANAIIDNLMQLNEIYDKDDENAARRAFERGKKLQLVQAVINTAAGIMSALGTPNVGDQLTGANWAKAAVVAATGITQIATINAQKFGGGGQPSGSSPSAPQIPSVQPSFNIVGQSGTNQILADIAGQFQNPVRAYVVNGDVMSGAELERKRIKTATFG